MKGSSGLGGVIYSDEITAVSRPSFHSQSGSILAGTSDGTFVTTSELLDFYTKESNYTVVAFQSLHTKYNALTG